MDKAQKTSVWTEVGYNIFAEEGLDGIQVERLARILQFNKSGFYHYFGDLEIFVEELLKLHQTKAKLYFEEVRNVKSIDPEFLCLLIKYKTSLMFHQQLVRSPSNSSFYKIAKKLDALTDVFLRDVWSDYLGLNENPDLAVRYLDIVRDMFYARINFENFNYTFLHNLITEVKVVMQQIAHNPHRKPRQSTF